MNLLLSTIIANHFSVSNAIIKLMTEFVLALIKVRDVNLTSIAIAICSQCKVESEYRKLQRFFANVEICYVCLAKLIIKLAKLENDKWVLVLDRTNWKFGKLDINLLVLSIDCFGIGVPILWSMLDNNGGSSNTPCFLIFAILNLYLIYWLILYHQIQILSLIYWSDFWGSAQIMIIYLQWNTKIYKKLHDFLSGKLLTDHSSWACHVGTSSAPRNHGFKLNHVY